MAEGIAPPDGPIDAAVAETLAAEVRRLLEAVPDGGRGLVVGHTPSLEAAASALTGRPVRAFAECEGVTLVEEAGEIRIEAEHRLDARPT